MDQKCVSAHLRPAWQQKPDVIHRYAKDAILKKLFPPVLLRICVPVSSLKKSQPNAQISIHNLTYRKISGFNPIIELNGKKESDFFFNHKMTKFNSESYLRKNSGFNPIIKSNHKKELHFFFNNKLHQIKNTLQVAKPLGLIP
jgi:hypothetical protein